ncbi:hypothetical protein OSTOST_25806, partial [Ostertagia ostertagi]
TRIAMKLHSFLRENMPRAIARKTSGAVVQRMIQGASKRQLCTSHASLLIEFVNLQFTQYVFPGMDSQDYTTLSVRSIVLSLFAGIVPGIVCLVSLFYGLLHSWLNGFAELMRFGDRQFYM